MKNFFGCRCPQRSRHCVFSIGGRKRSAAAVSIKNYKLKIMD
jgi:hypothetical protein